MYVEIKAPNPLCWALVVHPPPNSPPPPPLCSTAFTDGGCTTFHSANATTGQPQQIRNHCRHFPFGVIGPSKKPPIFRPHPAHQKSVSQKWTLLPGFLDTLYSLNENDKKVQPQQGPRVIAPYHRSCLNLLGPKLLRELSLSNCVGHDKILAKYDGPLRGSILRKRESKTQNGTQSKQPTRPQSQTSPSPSPVQDLGRHTRPRTSPSPSPAQVQPKTETQSSPRPGLESTMEHQIAQLTTRLCFLCPAAAASGGRTTKKVETRGNTLPSGIRARNHGTRTVTLCTGASCI